MIVEAYAALLLAFLSTERLVYFLPFLRIKHCCEHSQLLVFFFSVFSKGVRDAIADCLPDRNLAILVPVLDRFVVCI